MKKNMIVKQCASNPIASVATVLKTHFVPNKVIFGTFAGMGSGFGCDDISFESSIVNIQNFQSDIDFNVDPFSTWSLGLVWGNSFKVD